MQKSSVTFLLLISISLISCSDDKDGNSVAPPSFKIDSSFSSAEDQPKTILVSLDYEPITGGNCNSISGLSLTSSDETIVKAANVVWSGTTPNCSLQIIPEKNRNGLVSLSINYSHNGNSASQVVTANFTAVKDLISIDISEHNNSTNTSMCIATEAGVNCTGHNRYYQLGNGTNTTSYSPTPIAGLLGKVIQIEMGHYSTCALIDDGNVWCAGSGSYGQLGHGSFTNSTSWVQVTKNSDSSNLTGITQIQSGYLVNCAVDGANEVWCWGYNALGGLGDSSTVNKNRAVKVLKDNGAGGTEVLNDVKSVSGGNLFSCAHRNDNTVWCWGYNTIGYLGNNNTTNTSHAVQVLVDDGAGGQVNLTDVRNLSSAPYSSCVTLNSGKAYCWGANSNGRLGTGLNANSYFAREVVKHDSSVFNNAVKIDAAFDHACIVDGDTKMWCWGSNQFGQLGSGTRSAPQNKAIAVKDPSGSGNDWLGVESIITGSFTTCAIKEDLLYCWGSSNQGMIVNSSIQQDSIIPLSSTYLNNIKSLARSSSNEYSYFQCAIKTDDTGECWGANPYGQLGDASTNSSARPVKIKEPNGSSNLTGITSLSSGTNHACAISSNQIYCWGGSTGGIRGDGTNSLNTSSVKVQKDGGADFSDASEIAAGSYHSCSIDTSGQLWCWGSNSFGQLGDLSSTARTRAVRVYKDDGAGGSSLFNNAIAITVGNYFSCAIDTSNQVWCWGRGYSGALGNNATANSSKAVKALKDNGAGGTTDFNDAVKITHTFIGACALTTSKTVWCWGYGSYGQNGNGSYTASNFAVNVIKDSDDTPLSNIEKIEGSQFTVCSVDSSNTVWCWGNNKRGQLGSALIVDYSTSKAIQQYKDLAKTQVIDDATDISTGAYHTCYLNNSGSASCWGFSPTGISGNSKFSGSALPIISDYN